MVLFRRLRLLFALALAGISLSGARSAEAAMAFATDNMGRLLRFDTATPASVAALPISGLQPGEAIFGIDFRPVSGQLYGVSNQSRVYVLDPNTAAATPVSLVPFPVLTSTAMGMDFNPVVDLIRLINPVTNTNVRVNPVTGALAGTDTPLAYAAGDPNFGAIPFVAAVAYNTNFQGAPNTTLFDIDVGLDILARQGSPGGSPISPNTGQLFTIGPLGVNVTGNAAFDIAPNGNRFASLDVGGSTGLYTISLITGAATLIGEIGTGAQINGLAIQPQPGTLRFSDFSYTVSEAGVTADVTITRFPADGPVNVLLSALPGTAVNGVDYNFMPATQSITFFNQQTVAVVSIPVINNGIDQPDRSFLVSLSGPTDGATIGSPSIATVTITDDDLPPGLSIDDVTLAEGNAGTTSFVFTVTMTGGSAFPVTVNFSSAGSGANPATPGPDFAPQSGQLTFLPGGPAIQTITVPVTGDTAFEPNETFEITLSGAVNATITDDTGGGTIVNDDAAPTVSINDAEAREGEIVQFTVTLSQAAGQDVAVDFGTASGTAISGVDFVPQSGVLVIPAGQLTGVIDVETVDDNLCEFPNGENENFFVNLSNARAVGTPDIPLTITDSQGVGTICDEDGPATLELERIGDQDALLGLDPVERQVRATVKNGCGDLLSGVTIDFEVVGINATQGSVETDSTGTAIIAFEGRLPGDDALTAQAVGGCAPEAGPIQFTFLIPVLPRVDLLQVQGDGAVRRDGAASIFHVELNLQRRRLSGLLLHFDGPFVIGPNGREGQLQVRSTRILGVIPGANRAAVFGIGRLRIGRFVQTLPFRVDLEDGGPGQPTNDRFGILLGPTSFVPVDLQLTPLQRGFISIYLRPQQ